MTAEEIDLEGPYVAALIRRAIADEREACAQIADEEDSATWSPDAYEAATSIATRIRARAT